jgi:immunity protein, SdpI family
VRKWLPLVLIAADLAFTLAVYDRLPDRVATHFGAHGPDGWSSRAVAAWMIPAVALLVWALMRFLPLIDPHRENYRPFRWAYDSVVFGVVTVMVVIHGTLLANALGWPVPVELVVAFMVGALITLIGAVLPYARPTWFFGIRTPWTLSSDEVWARTHRLGGRLVMVAGVLIMTLGFLRSRAIVYAVVISAAAFILATIPYSYLVWRNLKADS